MAEDHSIDEEESVRLQSPLQSETTQKIEGKGGGGDTSVVVIINR
jgi:hypothetical protein